MIRNVKKKKRIFGHVRPAKIQINLRIRTVWSETSLSASRDLESMAIMVNSD